MSLVLLASQRHIAAILFAVLSIQTAARPGWAAVSATGNFLPPIPAGGGTLSGEVRVGIGNDDGDIFIASMTINDGTVLTDDDGIIGEMDGAFGEVLITGTQTAWNHDDELTVGNEGWGALTIQNAGRVLVGDDVFIGRLDSGRGEVFMDGLTSRLIIDDDFTVGNEGVAFLQAEGGSQIRSNDAFIGNVAGSDGHVVLSGSPTQWINTNDILIGGAGVGRLDISSAARVDQRAGTIGNTARSFGYVTVDGLQTFWSMSLDLNIGANGTGELHVSGGGQVQNRIGRIGSATSGRGDVTVSGARSTWQMSSDLFVGTMGTGFLSIDSSGLVSVDSTATIGLRGRLDFGGGRLIANNLINNGIITGSGEITAPLTNGATGEVRVGFAESLRITGAVSNAGRLESIGGAMEFLSAVDNNGPSGQIAARDAILRFQSGLDNDSTLLISIGETDVFGIVDNNPTGLVYLAGDARATFYDDFTNQGTLTIDPFALAVFGGDFLTAAGAAVVLELSETPRESEGSTPLAIGGAASLAGGLDVLAGADFAPAEGDIFTLLSADGGIGGTFGTTSFPALASGLDWSLTYGTNDVILRVIAEGLLRGDFNGNGAVEQGDLDLVLLNWGEDGTTPPAGWVNDLPEGLIDQAELDRILLNWGATAGASLAGSNVPEPAAWLVALLAGLAAATCRRNAGGLWHSE